MKTKETIGIDVSKLTIDVCIHSNQMFETFENSNNDYKTMINWVYKSSYFSKDEILFVFEHTGLYSLELSFFLSENNIPFTIVPGLAIKRSLGISRGKDDRIDAKNIALYAYRLKEEIKPYQMMSKGLLTLKNLLSLRERFVKQRAGYKASLKEQKRVLVKKDNQVLLDSQEKIIDQLSKLIENVDKEMEDIVMADDNLKNIFKLIVSVKGVGKQTALYMIVCTNAFTKFENARKFASYCGIAPFPHSSGTSIRGKTKVSNLANKTVKSLLNLCAIVAIQHNPEMKQYYERRIKEGKNKMSTINIIRNKLLARIFAVVERKTPYVDVMKYAA